MSNEFFSAVKSRRSVYALSKKAPIGDGRIQELLSEAIAHVPSPFNMQAGRVVLLKGAVHDAFWDNLKEVLRGIVKDPAAFADSAARVDGFKAAYGTVLFFEDQAVVEALQAKFAAYKDNFPVWSNQSSGMLQYVVWTAFAAEGIGASLQHYSPLVDDWVYANAGVPPSWKLIAQMPFGSPTAAPGEKSFAPVSERLKVVG